MKLCSYPWYQVRQPPRAGLGSVMSLCADSRNQFRQPTSRRFAPPCQLFCDPWYQVRQTGGLEEISRGQRPRYQRPLASRPGGALECSLSSGLIWNHQPPSPLQKRKLRNKAKSKILKYLPINKKHKQRAILSHKTKPKIKSNKACHAN
jgi:hypothetical protein